MRLSLSRLVARSGSPGEGAGARLRGRRRLALVAAAATIAGGTAAVAVGTANAATTGCNVAYTVQSQWTGGFTGNVVITNLGSAITSWTLAFDFPAAGQAVTNGWSATWA